MGQIENTEGIKFQICRKSKSICFSHWIKSLKIVGVKTLPERTESEKLKLVLVYPLKPFKKYSESICLERKFYILTELFPQLMDGFVWHFVQTFRVPRGWILANLVIPWGLHFLVSREKTITCIAMTFSTDVHALQACSFTFGEYDFIGRGISLAPKCFIFTGMRLGTILPLSKIN